jgi:hypothetical protein
VERAAPRLKITNAGNETGTLQNWTLHLMSDIPCNGHRVDQAQGVPMAVAGPPVVARLGAGDVRLNWTSVGSPNYHVWHSTDAQFAAASLGGASGGATTLIDTGAQRLPRMHCDLVRPVNSCR